MKIGHKLVLLTCETRQSKWFLTWSVNVIAFALRNALQHAYMRVVQILLCAHAYVCNMVCCDYYMQLYMAHNTALYIVYYIHTCNMQDCKELCAGS